jgi:hypothetical protein
MNHALYVLRAVPGLASIKAPAPRRVLHLASVFHATRAALKVSIVVTNVPGFVVKCALKAIATSVPLKMMLELIFSK